MQYNNKKRTTARHFRKICLVVALIAIFVATSLYMVNAKNTMFRELEAVESKIIKLEKRFDDINRETSYQLLNTLDVVTINQFKKDVIFSNYGTWDSHSGTITASGLTVNDFKVNTDGMYTYQGKVVLATANTTRLPYKLRDGFDSHELYEEIDFVINNKEYSGIVLDVCGTCTWGKQNEDLQRYDIFTTTNSIGLKEGWIYK